MIPVEFAQVNLVIAKDQPEYQPLPVCRRPCTFEGFQDSTEVVACFQMTPEEIAVVQATGKIWLRVMPFGMPLQPLMLQVEDPFTPPAT